MTKAVAPSLEQRLGYTFGDRALLDIALTHASAGARTDYQRLEFLGDRVLGLVVAERLYALYPDEPEGDLSRRHTALVRAETLARAARALDLGQAMILSESEEGSGGRGNENILSDIMEAVIGAVYLDGGLAAARALLLPLLDADIAAMAAPPRDPKTTLQEWTQAKGLGLPEYTLSDRTGPDHAPEFRVTLAVSKHEPVVATGPSKRAAEKAAAQAMIDKLGI